MGPAVVEFYDRSDIVVAGVVERTVCGHPKKKGDPDGQFTWVQSSSLSTVQRFNPLVLNLRFKDPNGDPHKDFGSMDQLECLKNS